MAKTSRLAARQATALERMEQVLADVIERLERIEQKLGQASAAKAWTSTSAPKPDQAPKTTHPMRTQEVGK